MPAGSSVYGVGYHNGSVDGHKEGMEEGFSAGVVAGVVATAVVGGTVTAAVWGWGKMKSYLAERHERRLEEASVPADASPDDAAEA